MFVRAGGRGARVRAGHQALGGALQLEDLGLAFVLAVNRGDQMRHLARQPVLLLVNLAPDLEQPEILEMFAVLGDISIDPRHERKTQQILIGRNGIGDAHVRIGIGAELLRQLLADKRVVVDLGEALRGEHGARRAVKRARLIDGRDRGQHRGRLGRDRIVTNHAAHFFHQIVLERDVFGGPPGWNGHGENARRRFAHPERQSLEDIADFHRRHSLRITQSTGNSTSGGGGISFF